MDDATDLLDFTETLRPGTPATAKVLPADKAETDLIRETEANHYRAEWYREQGKLP